VLVNGEPRHASQLYEAFLEGLVLSFVLWFYTRKPRPTAAASGLFLILYGAFRILIEFVRVPDEQLGYLTFGWVTMGQILSLPMVIIGAVMLVLALRAGLDSDGVPSAGTPRAAGGTMQKKAG
jgi:phosphatidylglycerol:prolipoprotein diacylglycerol transferase